ncbi:MAG TPA: hypothetical protein VJS67_00425 [Pseudonocardiaceae bacterium]|nr:hypothetical protein [Pseudonocardiaceae bacterium]
MSSPAGFDAGLGAAAAVGVTATGVGMVTGSGMTVHTSEVTMERPWKSPQRSGPAVSMMAGLLRMFKLTKASAVKARTRPSTNSKPSL